MGEIDIENSDLPGAYVPWDWNLYHDLKAAVERSARMTTRDLKEHYLYAPRRRQLEEQAKKDAHYEYIMKDIGKFVDRMMEETSDRELELYFGRGAKYAPKKKDRIYFS